MADCSFAIRCEHLDPARIPRDLDGDTIKALGHDQTIRPNELDTAELRAIAMLRDLSPGASVKLELGTVIGEASVAFALGLCGFGWFTRATFGSTAVNRRALASAVCLFLAQTALGLAAWLLDIPLTETLIFAMLIWAVVVALLAIHFDRRLTVSAVGT